MNTSRRKFIAKSMLTTVGLTTGLDSAGLPFISSFSKAKTENRKAINKDEDFKISIFSKHLQWLDYAEMASLASEIGFDGVDLTVRPNGHVLPERVKEDLPKAVEAVRKAGLEVYMITTAITDPNDRYTEDIIKTAGELGIGYYRLGWFSFDKKVSIEENLSQFKKTFAGLHALNQKYKIKGDYQNHSGTQLGGSIWDLWLCIKDLNPEWIGCQYDIRHATVEGAMSWPVGLQLIRPFINTLDIKDFLWEKEGEGWKLQNVPLAEGMVDFNKFFNLVKDYEISAPISLHFEYPLGGAEHGATEIKIGKAEISKYMKQDLKTLRNWLKEAGLV
ncbi:sugar phosphate isomerase/epimerase [soil metagenome]